MKKIVKKFTEYILKNKSNFIFLIFVICSFIFINVIARVAFDDLLIETDNSIVTYNDFKSLVEEGKVKSVEIDLNYSVFKFEDSDGNLKETDNPKIDNFKEYLLSNNIEVKEVKINSNTGVSAFDIARIMLPLVFMIVLMRNMMPKTDSKMLEKAIVPETTFDDIAGNVELKKDLGFIVEFLKNPEQMEKAGARMPKGIILTGPPGTGKTLTAKAIAGTAGVPFYSASGSNFVEMFVGLGAKRVRDLYAKAKKNSPCIVFIDEIDAVGGKRGASNNSEKDQTINALLTELDGFDGNSGIVTICATNRIEDLDSALIRPGRFDKQLYVGLPEKKDRKEIIKVYTNNKKFAEDVDFDDLATMTSGFSGADIEALMNEAALITATKGKEIINNEALETAYFRMVVKGDKKENQEQRDKEELKLVAWHEAGHTLVTKLLTKDSVSKVTILASTSGAGGITFRTPPESNLHSKDYLEKSIQIMYGGRAAEEILYNGDKSKITTGASSDIKQATKLIKNYISYFGMSEEFGMINIDEFSGSNSVISNGVNDKMLANASKMSNELYEKTLNILNENRDLLEVLAENLLKYETLKEEDIDKIINKEKKENQNA